MLTTPDQRAEAARLVDLDERGLLLEAVALALRLGETQERAMQELVALDREFIKEISDGESSWGSLPFEGEE
tara:strand:- start:2497 stop:2712 length:216 start_codon:yes stop_codon:yes gene_type:complete